MAWRTDEPEYVSMNVLLAALLILLPNLAALLPVLLYAVTR